MSSLKRYSGVMSQVVLVQSASLLKRSGATTPEPLTASMPPGPMITMFGLPAVSVAVSVVSVMSLVSQVWRRPRVSAARSVKRYLRLPNSAKLFESWSQELVEYCSRVVPERKRSCVDSESACRL
ncbi:hypothetical protein FQZ97_575680 [compost metagenome]